MRGIPLALALLLACGPGDAARPRAGEPAAVGAEVGQEQLAGGLASLDALGAAIVAGLNAGDADALTALAVSADEYTGRLFPAIATHPAAEAMGRDLLWDMHARQSRDDMLRAIELYGRQDLRFVRLEPRGVATRAGVRFHDRPRLVVTDAQGRERSLQVLASVIEHEPSHTFKLLGYRDHD